MSAVSDAVLALSPEGYWRLGETSGTTAADTSGHSRDGTYSGTYTLGSASLVPSDTSDKALSLAGSGYVSIPHSSSFDVGSAFSFFCRCLRSTNAGYQAIFHKGDYAGAGQQGVTLRYNASTNDVAVVWFNGTWYDSIFSGVASMASANSLMLVYDGATGLKLIVDGSSIYTNTLPTAFVSNTKGLLLGATRSSSVSPSLSAVVDECVWISRAVTDAEAADLHSVVINTTPIYSIQSGSTLSFSAGASFSLSGSSDFVPQTSRRALNIDSWSSAVFKTDQRNFSIASGSDLLPRAGTMFALTLGSSLDFHIQHTRRAAAEINGSSSVSGSSRSLFLTGAQIKTSSTPRMKGGYNAMMRAVFAGMSSLRARSSTLSKSAFSSGTYSSPIFVSRVVLPASYAVGTASLVSLGTASIKPTSAHAAGGSAISLVGISAKQAAFSSAGNTGFQFYASYTTQPVPAVASDDVIFAKARPLSVFVRQ